MNFQAQRQVDRAMSNEANGGNSRDPAGKTPADAQMFQAANPAWEFYLHALNVVNSPAIAIDRMGFVLGVNRRWTPCSMTIFALGTSVC